MIFSDFFSYVQETRWYREFLNPVVDEIPAHSSVLDIGAGTGKLLQILSLEKEVQCTGTDTDPGMLQRARRKLGQVPAQLIPTEAGGALPFEDGRFDVVSICNVLFLLPENGVLQILSEARRVVRNGGKIVILHPSGRTTPRDLNRKFPFLLNPTAAMWYFATRNQARFWCRDNPLARFCSEHQLKYGRNTVFEGYALLEVIQ
ncbi:MAG: class I SAM-dependent methyltransferase [Haliscomenobacter sp.]|nr:class I SAM-dependent methyltransferase [Haliscomenobacter sp.]MBK8654842.1 class I SAM-dependent methyltransferase [Haliscomenobacter sp.]MBP9075279.1 class I SAM-dependent methyltransferase [Haliscomenobacter sp.]MBP9872738.1 class I SAM-dependent methyltransferase [Haliscomenobacter sp.]